MVAPNDSALLLRSKNHGFLLQRERAETLENRNFFSAP